MSEVINLNRTTPSAEAGYVLGRWQRATTASGTDATSGDPFFDTSVELANVGGAVPKTANYTAIAGDCGTLLSFNSAGAVTLTLPATPPPIGTSPTNLWKIAVQNIGTGALTVNRNGLTIDGTAANLTLNQNSGLDIFTDGANYFTVRGSVFISPLTTKGDLYGHSTVDARVPVGADGTVLVADSTQALGVNYVTRKRTLVFSIDASTTGAKKPLFVVPINCTITGFSISGDVSGSASVDLWFIAGSGVPPTVPNIPTSANKITATAPIVLSSAESASGGSSAISTWTKTLTQWGSIVANLSSSTTVIRLTVEVFLTENN